MTVEINLHFLALILFLIQVTAGVLDVQTATTAGIIRGKNKYLPELNKEVEEYLSVRYAKPPINELRFKEPIPMPKSQDFLGSSKLPPTCPQTEFASFKGFKGMRALEIYSEMDEDCLFLNIWKPKSGSPKKPVIVWVYGGGFNHGSTSFPMYDGSYLAAWSDAVVVSIQYRVGPFGFLSTGDDFAPGNAGLKDQELALKWVNEHIDKFWGDNESITIVGQSAGSVSVGLLVLNDETSKLFKRAIMLSGSPTGVWGLMGSSEAKQISINLATRLGADNKSVEDIKRHLTNKSFTEILSKLKNMQADIPLKFYFLPTIGSPLVPEHPILMLKKAKHLKGKEMVVGWTKDEGSIFLAFEMNAAKMINDALETPLISEESFKDRLAFAVGGDKNIAAELSKLYREKPLLKGLVNLKNDMSMKCEINQFVEEARKLGATVFHFEYDYRSNSTVWPEWYGVEHGALIEMLFGVPLYNQSQFTYDDLEVCKEFMNRNKRFVHHGNPNLAGHESWFDNKMFVYGKTKENTDDRTRACAKLKEVIPHYLSGSFSLYANFIGVLSLLLILRELI